MSIMKVFIDSSIIVEALKGNDIASDMLKELIERDADLMINPIVFSESVYIFIRYAGRTKLRRLFELLNSFIMLDLSSNIVNVSEDYIDRFNLLPNDALILATCKLYEIENIVSLDDDYKKPCKELGIRLIDRIEKVKRL